MKRGTTTTFEVEEHVSYPTAYMHDNTKQRPAKQRSPGRATGRIIRIHPKAGRNGSADIHPDTGGKKINRRLQLLARTSAIGLS